MGVSGMLEPVKSRFTTIVELEASIEDWAVWAKGAEVHPMVIAYLLFETEMLHKYEPTADMTNTPSPRTWENFSDVLKFNLEDSSRREAGAGAVGESAAHHFFAFEEQHAHLPASAAIIADPESFDIRNTPPSALYVVVTTLAIRADASNFAAVCRFAERLESDGRGEFASLVLRDALRRSPELKATPEYAAILTGPIGTIMSGSTIS